MIEVDPAYREAFASHGLASAEAVRQHFDPEGREPVHDVVLVRTDFAGETVYYKQYELPRPSWKFAFRPSKARCEYHNYAVLQALGLRTARRLACGEERDGLGRLRRAFIVTREVPNTRTLVEAFDGPLADRADRAIRRRRSAILVALARAIRAFHDAGFFHRDLVWRNILVDDEDAIWWIDCPRGGHCRTWRHRRWLRDLGAFDKSAARQATDTERLEFAFAYCGSRGDRAKRQVQQVLTYWRQRWPEDWIER